MQALEQQQSRVKQAQEAAKAAASPPAKCVQACLQALPWCTMTSIDACLLPRPAGNAQLAARHTQQPLWVGTGLKLPNLLWTPWRQPRGRWHSRWAALTLP